MSSGCTNGHLDLRSNDLFGFLSHKSAMCLSNLTLKLAIMLDVSRAEDLLSDLDGIITNSMVSVALLDPKPHFRKMQND